MDAEQLKEWIDFERRAIQLVRKGNVPDEIGVMRLFQVLILPSFDEAVSWDVCREQSTSGDRRYFAVQTRWKRQVDMKMFETPVERLRHPKALYPTLGANTFEISSDAVERFLDKLRTATIPAYVEAKSIGADGTRYELSFDDYFVGARYSWWEEPPDEWKEIGVAVLMFLKEVGVEVGEERAGEH
jgi:hypothetical protein